MHYKILNFTGHVRWHQIMTLYVKTTYQINEYLQQLGVPRIGQTSNP